jgi:hypothetical protein
VDIASGHSAGCGTIVYSAVGHVGAGAGPMVGTAGSARRPGSGVRIVVGLFVAWLVLYRYMFVFPIFVIQHGAGDGFVDWCVSRTKQVWRTGVLLMLAAGVPELLPSVIRLAVWGRLSRPRGIGGVADLVILLAADCFTVWFVLLRTELALQLVGAVQPIQTAGEGPLGLPAE